MSSVKDASPLAPGEALSLFLKQGSISSVSSPVLSVRWQVEDPVQAAQVETYLGAPAQGRDDLALVWEGAAALDVLGQLLGAAGGGRESERRPASKEGKLREVSESFQAWSRKVSGIVAADFPHAALYVERVDPAAVLPSKERISDSGYDLTLINVKKQMGLVVLYGTGIKVQTPLGWYLDVVPRSSIIKRGYLLANNVGVIDQTYRGEIMVPLLKVDPSAQDLELPARVAQLILRPVVHFPVIEREELVQTERGEGGFGSTGQ